MFTVSLIEPQIPPNTGNIARLCAATFCKLEIVGKIGFELTDKYLKRAGLDYWKFLDWEYFPNTEKYFESCDPSQMYLFTTKVKKAYTSQSFQKGDYLIFGSETAGINEKYLQQYSSRCSNSE